MSSGINLKDYQVYSRNVREDVEELKRQYPFCSLIIAPTRDPSPFALSVVAVNIDIIRNTQAFPEDFKGKYSYELSIEIPFTYKTDGCLVYGAKWLQKDRIPKPDWHFFEGINGTHRFCVGIPESFKELNNVILENIKTAEKMLIAYQLYVSEKTDRLELLAYPHDYKGGYCTR